MRSAMDVLSDSIQRLEENGRRMLAEIERLTGRIKRLEGAGDALANASMVCPEDIEQEREAWRDLRGEK